MRLSFIFIITLCMLNSCSSPLASLSWIEGDWTMTTKKGEQRMELWRKADKNLYTGKGVKVASGDTTLLESIRLSYHDEQTWYIPTVPDQNNAQPVPFKMVQSGENKVVFENPDHDFPQRILYQYLPGVKNSKDADSLYVRVEGLDGKGIDYWFRKM